MSDDNGIGGAVGGLAAMAASVGIAYFILVTILAVTAFFIIMIVLMVAGIIAYIYAIFTADSRKSAATLIFMPFIGVLSYLVCHSIFYKDLRYMMEYQEEMTAVSWILVAVYWLGVFAFIAAAYLTYESATGYGLSTAGLVGTGILWAWSGVTFTMALIANDVLHS